MDKLGIIANPNAGPSKGSWRQLQKVYAFANRNGFTTHVTNKISDVRGALIKLIEEQDVECLCVYGGDGTLHVVVDILLYEHTRGKISRIPKLCSLGGGTMDAVHKTYLGWEVKPFQVLERVTFYSRPPTEVIRPLAITFQNQQKGREETHYGFMFIMGPITRVVKLYDERGRSIRNGLRTIGLASLAAVTGWPKSHAELLERFDTEMWLDGEKQDGQPWTMSVFCNATNSLIFNIKPFLGQKENGQFFALAYKILPWQAAVLAPLIAKQYWVPNLSDPKYFNRPVSSFRIVTPEMLMHLDGEFFWVEPDTPINIVPGPELEMIPAF